MKKYIGINRDKISLFHNAKLNTMKKKNRFKIAGKDQNQLLAQPSSTNGLITNTTQNSSNQEQQQTINKTVEIYDKAMQNLQATNQIKKKVVQQCKLRITVFKESEAKKYDENINQLSKEAVNHLLTAEKYLSEIRKLKGSTEIQEKYYRNMEKSLAQEIRESSRELRAQEKQHYERLKAYERGTKNMAIELSETQKQKMKSDFQFDYQELSSGGLVQEFQSNSRDSQIGELVKSINKLSHIYKQLNQLVIMQGSIIDRIDVNIQQTLTHVQQGNKHLHNADQHASSPCAQKCMLVLFSLIMILAVILGIKYSKQ